MASGSRTWYSSAVLGVVLCVSWSASVQAGPHDLYGAGKCGMTRTFVSYAAKVAPQWVIPSHLAKDSDMTYAQVNFTQSYMSIELRANSGNASQICVYPCADSTQVGRLTTIMTGKGILVSGGGFGCKEPPEKMNFAEPEFMTEVLMPADCGGFFQVALQVPSQAREQWYRKMNIMTYVDFTPTGTTNYYYMTCNNTLTEQQPPYPTGTTIINLNVGLTANPPRFDYQELWKRQGLYIVALAFILFAAGWIHMFVATSGGTKDAEDDEDTDSSDDDKDSDEDEDTMLCPNCGEPYEVKEQGACEFCGKSLQPQRAVRM